MTDNDAIRYPRRVAYRTFMRGLGRLAFGLLSRTEVVGREHFPERGPLILVGNHSAFVEPALMGLYAPYLVEILGTGDIPLDPAYAWLIQSYGYIPINRGNLDRKGLNAALDVLKQGGVIGIFPEGGIWEAGAKQARTGVAWLSQAGNAPVLPIGFGGIHGAIGKIMRLQRPRMVMRVGELMPPVKVSGAGRKAAMEAAANEIMARVEALIPDEDKVAPQAPETFDLDVRAGDRLLTDVFTPAERAALGRFLSQRVLLNTFRRNLRLPVTALQQRDTPQPGGDVAQAAGAIVNYLETTNPQFFNYRFGYEAGAAVQSALAKLRDLGRQAEAEGTMITLQPQVQREPVNPPTAP